MKKLLFRASALALLTAMACSSSTDDSGSNAPPKTSTIVPPGKADNYFSTKGQEYTVTGATFGQVEASCLSANASSPIPKSTALSKASVSRTSPSAGS